VVGLVEWERDAAVTHVSVQVDVDAPPEAVWRVVSDPRNLPRWERHIERVEGLPREGLRTGVTYVTVMRFMTVRARVNAEVVEWSPPGYSQIRLSGLLDATITTSVRPRRDGGSVLEHDVDYAFRGGALGDLAARSLRFLGGADYALRRGALAQKRAIEDGA
jgi:uncharacterized protein YndB with AHSA1/START domain